MFREFETTIDDQGHFDIPVEMRERHGMRNDARVKIEEFGADILIKNAETDEERTDEERTDEERKARQKAAIRAAVGILPSDSKIVEHLLEERRKDREREDRPFGI